jgi:dCMP deaminase
MENWDRRFMGLACHVAEWSKDRSRKIGSVVVGPSHDVRATGYNGFARDVFDNVDDRHERPAKYLWTEHAERNAIYNAARSGAVTEGCTLYVNLHPCAGCARAILQSGIQTVVTFPPDFADPTLGDEIRVAHEMFDEVSKYKPGFFQVRYMSHSASLGSSEGLEHPLVPKLGE